MRTSTLQDEPRLIALWREAFPSVASFEGWLSDPKRHDNTLVMSGEREIKAAIYLVDLTVGTGVGTQTRRILGIGSVACAVTARGQGLIKQLLTGVNDLAALRGVDFGLLFTGTPGVYAGAGWSNFPNELLVARAQAGEHLRPVGWEPQDIGYSQLSSMERAQVRATYQRWSVGKPFAVVRNEYEWAVADRRYAEARIVLTNRGYAILEDLADSVRVAEFVPAPSWELEMARLVQAVTAGQGEIEFRVHRTKETRYALETVFGPLETRIDNDGMIRPFAMAEHEVLELVTAPQSQFSVGDYF